MDWLFHLEPGDNFFIWNFFKIKYKEASIMPSCVTKHCIFPAVSKGIIFNLHFISMRIVSFYYKDEDFIFASLLVVLFIEILEFIR